MPQKSGLVRTVFINRADGGTVTAGSALTNFPASNVQDANINKIWRAVGTDSHILLDMAGTFTVRCVAAINVPKTTSAARVRISTSDFTGISGDAYDSGDIPSPVHSSTGQFVHTFLSGAAGRYIRLDINGGENAVQIGKLVVGDVYSFKHDIYEQNHEILWRDYSRIVYSLGGVKFTDIRPTQRGIRVVSRGDSYLEILTGVQEINRICGTSRDFLFILDPDASPQERSRDAIWGSMENPARIGSLAQNVYLFEFEMWARI